MKPATSAAIPLRLKSVGLLILVSVTFALAILAAFILSVKKLL
jgi:hypothetical protein